MNAEEMIAHAESLSLDYTNGMHNRVSKRAGLYRRVTVEGDYAFKAVHSEKDAEYNRAEWDFYTMTTDEIRAMLAKCVYISRNGNILVMERCTPWYERSEHFDSEPLSEIERELDRATEHAHGFVIGDLHGNNWGVREDGTVVVLDYGDVLYRVNDRIEPDESYNRNVMGEVFSPLVVA